MLLGVEQLTKFVHTMMIRLRVAARYLPIKTTLRGKIVTQTKIRTLKVVSVVAILGAIHCVAPASSSELEKKSGYSLGPDRCGTGGLSFPKIQIDMKKGFCAGLVASEENDLRFPRSIVQISGQSSS